MFNLTAKLSRLMQHLDPAKRGMLLRIKKDATGLRSLTSAPRSIKQSMNTGTMALVPEESVDDHQEDLGVFGTEEIQETLKAMKYQFDFRVFGVRISDDLAFRILISFSIPTWLPSRAFLIPHSLDI